MRARWTAAFAALALVVALCLPALADEVGVVRGTLSDLNHGYFCPSPRKVPNRGRRLSVLYNPNSLVTPKLKPP